MTFGETAVGLNFNPSNDPNVQICKEIFARAIDQMNHLRTNIGCKPGQARHASAAITMLEDAQMRAVKAITWKTN